MIAKPDLVLVRPEMGEKAPSALATLSLPFSFSTDPSDASEVKSLDLLAALPTPPHNQTEDVRWEWDQK